MTKIFAVIGIGFVATMVYVVTVFLSCMMNPEDTDLASGVSGCLLFVCVVILWATMECPFFVG